MLGDSCLSILLPTVIQMGVVSAIFKCFMSRRMWSTEHTKIGLTIGHILSCCERVLSWG